MLQKFRHYFDSKIPITADEWEMIMPICIPKELKKGEFLLKEGEIWRYVAIVIEGCIRTYRADREGKIRILNFVIENGWTGDTHSLQNSVPSVLTIDAIENSSVMLMKVEEFDRLCRQLPHLNQLMNDNLKTCLSESYERIDLATTVTADEKYRSFSINHPELLLRIPQYMIASYLGMTPESLSRVKKKLVKDQLVLT